MNVFECGLTDQIFSFFGDDGCEYHWNASKIIEALNNDKLTPLARLSIDITDDIYEHVSKKNGIEAHHLVTIDEERLKVPVLFVEFPGKPDPTHVLIDGNHRLVAAYHRGLRKLPAVAFALEDLKPYEVQGIGDLQRTPA